MIEVLFGCVGEEIELVYGGKIGDEEIREVISIGGRGLDDGVFLGIEVYVDEWYFGEDFGENLDL